MNDDVMRLSDLVPEYARYYKVSLQDAAYALHEIFAELGAHHHSRQPYKAIPDQVIWVGRVGSPARSAKVYKLYFSVLAEYFNGLIGSSDNFESKVVRCLYVGERTDSKDIMPGMVYVSKSLLGKLIGEAINDSLGFLFNKEPEKDSYRLSKEEIKIFQGKELVSVQGLARGLLEMIIEVDRAHRGVSKKIDPEAILIAAQKLGQESSDTEWYEDLAALARAVEIEDFRSNRKTLKRYVGKRP